MPMDEFGFDRYTLNKQVGTIKDCLVDSVF